MKIEAEVSKMNSEQGIDQPKKKRVERSVSSDREAKPWRINSKVKKSSKKASTDI